MVIRSSIFSFSVLLLLASGAVNGQQGGFMLVSESVSDHPASENATYDCAIYNLWTAERQPVNFPEEGGWSRAIVVAHKKRYRMFRNRGQATVGIKTVAETGNPFPLGEEVAAQMARGNVLDTRTFGIFPNFVGASASISGLVFDKANSFLSLASMIAPSPDWFAGVVGLRMRRGMRWKSEIIANLYAYDAGTDDGETYMSEDDPVDGPPYNPIMRFRRNNAPAGGELLDPSGKAVPAVLRLECTLQEDPPEETCDANLGTECDEDEDECCVGLVCAEDTCQACGVMRQSCEVVPCCDGFRCTDAGICRPMSM